jgi:hypothetical protein
MENTLQIARCSLLGFAVVSLAAGKLATAQGTMHDQQHPYSAKEVDTK